jgi:hypothetical protein
MSMMVKKVGDAMREEGFYTDEGGVVWNVKDLARAAIAAMREPSEAMLAEGPGEPYMDPWVWGKMIDAALREPESQDAPQGRQSDPATPR